MKLWSHTEGCVLYAENIVYRDSLASAPKSKKTCKVHKYREIG